MSIQQKIKNRVKKLFSLQKGEANDLEKEQKRLREFPRFKETEVLFEGKLIKIADAASYLFIYDEMFKKEIYKFISNKKDPLIIDCGANVGLSIMYFKKIYPQSHIIGFEPDPKIFEMLNKNISELKFENVKLYNNALWNEKKELVFFSEGADGGRLQKTGEENDSKKENFIKIKTLMLSDFLNSSVDLLKIDIEGAELEVLKESESLLGNVDKLFIEYHSFINEEQKLHGLLEILKNAGFRYNIQHIGVFSKHPFVKIDNYSGMDLQLNIFAYR